MNTVAFSTLQALAQAVKNAYINRQIQLENAKKGHLIFFGIKVVQIRVASSCTTCNKNSPSIEYKLPHNECLLAKSNFNLEDEFPYILA